MGHPSPAEFANPVVIRVLKDLVAPQVGAFDIKSQSVKT
jgi:hypothetical protein